LTRQRGQRAGEEEEFGRIGLGTAPLAFSGRSVDDGVQVTLAALESGVRLIDTALAYTRPGIESFAEGVVTSALRQWRGEQPIVATKGGHWRDGDAFPVDGRPSALRRHCEISLRTLGVQRIDLYQLHHVDPDVPLAESVGALAGLRDEGKVAAIGLSNVTIAQLEEARTVASITSVQNRLSFAVREDLPMVEYCTREGIRYLAYMPLGGPGAIAGNAFAPLRSLGARTGRSAHRLAVGWVLAQSDAVVALVGATRPASIRDSAAAAPLAPELLADLG
jgi:aryl-alcohol dehydrogenase-like predicted oxidoreductase